MFAKYNKEIRMLLRGLVQIAYYMRGAVQIDELKNMTHVEREMMVEFIEKRLEIEKDKPFPQY
jgi:hypothetical protein